jgi:hypothetical protein
VIGFENDMIENAKFLQGRIRSIIECEGLLVGSGANADRECGQPKPEAKALANGHLANLLYESVFQTR